MSTQRLFKVNFSKLPVNIYALTFSSEHTGNADHYPMITRCLNSILENTDPAKYRLHIGCNNLSPRAMKFIDRLVAEHGAVKYIGDAMEDPRGRTVYPKYPLMRRMYQATGGRISTKEAADWVIWFDDDSYVTKNDWLERLEERINTSTGIHQFGKQSGIVLTPSSVRWARKRPWFKPEIGIPLLDSSDNGEQPGFSFIRGGFYALSRHAIDTCSIPDPALFHNRGDWATSLALLHSDMQVGPFTYGVEIDAGPRRGIHNNEWAPMDNPSLAKKSWVDETPHKFKAAATAAIAHTGNSGITEAGHRNTGDIIIDLPPTHAPSANGQSAAAIQMEQPDSASGKGKKTSSRRYAPQPINPAARGPAGTSNDPGYRVHYPANTAQRQSHKHAHRLETKSRNSDTVVQAQANSASIPDAFRLAQEHFDNKRLKKAALICKQILETKPDHARSLHLLGLIYYKRTRYRAANTVLLQALKIRPKWYSLHNDLGAVLAAQGRHQEALQSYRQALALVEDPGDKEKLLPLYRNMAVACQRVGNLQEAMDFHEKALAFNPNDVDAIWNRAHIYLANGDFERGWQDYEKRLHLTSHEKPFRRHRLLQPRWDGGSFRHKTLLVQDEQGLGDVFQFVRLLPLVKSMGGIVILETRRKLTGILSGVKGADEVISREDARGQRQRFDLYTSLLSLPGLLNIRLDSIPAEIPYLHPDPVKVARWARFLDCKTFRVGLVWTGNLDNISLRHRSLNFSQLAAYLDMPDVEYFSLQFGDTAKQAIAPGLPFEVEDLSDYVGSFSELAAIAENMDLIITVDTAMAHLVGALGRPVWMLLSYPPDWRWLLDRDDSPWYPTMRLFRQDQDVDWEPVLRRLHRELKEEIAAFNESMKPARKNVFRRIGSWFRK